MNEQNPKSELTAFDLRLQHLYNENTIIAPTITLKRGKVNPRCKFFNRAKGAQCKSSARGNGYCLAHADCEFLTTTEGAEILGIDNRQLLKVLGGNPDREIDLGYGRKTYGWKPDRIAALVGKVEPPKPRKRKDWTPVFAQRYPNKAAATPVACAAMFNLNRYAKHSECRKANIDEIYALKNALIDYLIAHGYLVRAYRHYITYPPKPCFNCYGTGQLANKGDGGYDFGDSDDEAPVRFVGQGSERCNKCNGTGNYKPALRLSYIALLFDVAGTHYSWHQKEGALQAKVELSAPPAEENWQPETEKPLTMPKAKFSEAKALIRWLTTYEREAHP